MIYVTEYRSLYVFKDGKLHLIERYSPTNIKIPVIPTLRKSKAYYITCNQLNIPYLDYSSGKILVDNICDVSEKYSTIINYRDIYVYNGKLYNDLDIAITRMSEDKNSYILHPNINLTLVYKNDTILLNSEKDLEEFKEEHDVIELVKKEAPMLIEIQGLEIT